MSIEAGIRRWLLASGLPEEQVVHRDYEGEFVVPRVTYWLESQTPLGAGPLRTHDPVETDGVLYEQQDHAYEGRIAVVFVGEAVTRAQRLDMWAMTQEGMDAAERSSITVHSTEWAQRPAVTVNEQRHPRADVVVNVSYVRGIRSRVDIATSVDPRVHFDC